MWLECRLNGILEAITKENEKQNINMNLSEILDQNAITLAICHHTTLKHKAVTA